VREARSFRRTDSLVEPVFCGEGASSCAVVARLLGRKPRLRVLVCVQRPSIALELSGQPVQPVQPRVPACKGGAREIASLRPIRRELLEPSSSVIGLGGQYVRSIGRRHSGLSPESNGLRLPEALPLDMKSCLVLGRDGGMEPAGDVPPKGATHCAPLAHALGRTTAAKPHRVVDAGNDAHARSLRRDRKHLRAFQTTRTGEVTPLAAKHHAAAHDRRAPAGRRR